MQFRFSEQSTLQTFDCNGCRAVLIPPQADVLQIGAPALARGSRAINTYGLFVRSNAHIGSKRLPAGSGVAGEGGRTGQSARQGPPDLTTVLGAWARAQALWSDITRLRIYR